MSNKKIPEPIARLTEEFVSQIREFYGDRLNKVILYGSYARGEQHENSDVDYLVVLNDEKIKTLREISSISSITSSLGLKYNVRVSAVPFTTNKLSSGDTPLGLNIHKEGILL